jgi:hypothetical protein
MSTLFEIFLTRGVPGIVEVLEEMYQEYIKAKETPQPAPFVPAPVVHEEEVKNG